MMFLLPPATSSFKHKSCSYIGKQRTGGKFFKRLYFLKQFQIHSKIERKIQGFPIHFLPLHMHSLPHHQQPYQSGTFITTDQPALTPHHPKSTLYVTAHSCLCGTGQCVSCIHHYPIIQSLAALKILCPPPLLLLTPAITPDLLTVSVLPFSKCHIAGTIQHTVFSDWLLLLSNMYLRFCHVFSWLDSSCYQKAWHGIWCLVWEHNLERLNKILLFRYYLITIEKKQKDF